MEELLLVNDSLLLVDDSLLVNEDSLPLAEDEVLLREVVEDPLVLEDGIAESPRERDWRLNRTAHSRYRSAHGLLLRGHLAEAIELALHLIRDAPAGVAS